MNLERLPAAFAVLLPASLAAQDFATTVLFCRSDVTASVALGDLDGDGDLDIVYGNGRHYPERNLIYLNDGDGAFHGEYPLFPVARKTYSIALSDLDGDGDLDAVEGTDFGDYNQIFFNSGTGTFTAGPILDSGNGLGGRDLAVRHVVVEDLDGDGAADIVLVTRGGPDVVFWNDSAGGRWTPQWLDQGVTESIKATIGDVDGDGNTDIVIARRGPNAIHFNEGARSFRTVMLSAGAAASTAVAVADLDGRDGLDLVFGNEAGPNTIHWNDGRGGFDLSSTFGTGDDNTRAVRAADLDGDGDLDLIVGNLQRGFMMLGPSSWALPVLDQPNRIYINTGRRSFEDGPTFGQSGSQTRDVAVADLDGDGRWDVVEANDCAANAVHLRR